MNSEIGDIAKKSGNASVEADADRWPRWVPEERPSELAVAFFLFVLTCVYLRLFYTYTLLNADEGIITLGAERILKGQVLYRDFFSFFTPGSYYWTAMLFKVFGNSILVARGALMVYGGIFSALTYLLARRVCSRWVSILTAYAVAMVCLPSRFLALHNWDSTLWAYLALYAAVRLLEQPCWSRALVAGILVSLTCLFEQSKGGGLVLGLAMGFGAILISKNFRAKFSRRVLASFLLGFAFPAIITVVYFASQHSLGPMLEDCLWPLNHYLSANKVSYGFIQFSDSDRHLLLSGSWPMRLFILFILSPYFLIPALPLFAVGCLYYWLAAFWKNGDSQDVSSYYVLVSAALVGLLLSTLATGRADLNHLLYQTPLFSLVLAWGMGGYGMRLQGLNSIRSLLMFLVLFSFTALGLAILSGPLSAKVTISTRRGTLKGNHRDAALEKLQAAVPPGTEIFVYPYQPLYYYLSATSNPTPYEYLQVGQETPEQFEEAIRVIERKRTAVVLFQPSFSDLVSKVWPGTPLEVLGAKDAGAEYILSHYRPCETLETLQTWHYVFMVRKDLSCAGPF